jgi:hypothetical protein
MMTARGQSSLREGHNWSNSMTTLMSSVSAAAPAEPGPGGGHRTYIPRIPGLPRLTAQRGRRGHNAHAQAASGIESGHPRRTRPGNSLRRPAARPARNHLLGRRNTGRPAMTGARQPLLIPQTGVGDGPQPPQSQ